ncbi:unnamed protein product [Mytilus edulis]|uniref:Uncharacterized protein n=1 Tax=Mytilus edulis TaxID=6550 RepID=A0A8S3Q6Z5_MYTED|nr:unnamed protein product [Mytilus edulis]
MTVNANYGCTERGGICSNSSDCPMNGGDQEKLEVNCCKGKACCKCTDTCPSGSSCIPSNATCDGGNGIVDPSLCCGDQVCCTPCVDNNGCTNRGGMCSDSSDCPTTGGEQEKLEVNCCQAKACCNCTDMCPEGSSCISSNATCDGGNGTVNASLCCGDQVCCTPFIKSEAKLIYKRCKFNKFKISSCSLVLFTDKGNCRIIVHDVTGRHVEDIPLSAEPFDITAIDNNMVAVTFGRKQYFEIININTKEVTKKTTDGNSWGITYENGNLYMIVDGSMHGINVAVMTSSGELFKMIPVSTDFDQTEYVAVNGDSLFFTVFIPKDLVCMDVNGVVQWQFQKNIFNQPRGVTTDTLGNIFVAGFSSHNVIAVQKSGSEGSEILNKNEGLNYPTSIYCDKTNNRLLVSNLYNGHAHLFNIVYN